MADVFARSRAPFVPRMILLAIADRVNKTSGIAWCSVADIAERTGATERTVRRAINRTLERLGELQVERRTGRTHRFQITLRADARPRTLCPPPPDSLTGHPGLSDRRTSQRTRSEPVGIHSRRRVRVRKHGAA
jgi:Helix-turn-helix domain